MKVYERMMKQAQLCLRLALGFGLVGLDYYTVAVVQNATFGNLFDRFIGLGLIC